MSARALDLRPAELRVTIALGAAVLIQSALALVWAGAAAERLVQLERRADASAELLERAARLEEQTAAMRASLARIEARLDRQNQENRQ
jgi:Tfp pilus assembly protein PilE